MLHCLLIFVRATVLGILFLFVCLPATVNAQSSFNGLVNQNSLGTRFSLPVTVYAQQAPGGRSSWSHPSPQRPNYGYGQGGYPGFPYPGFPYASASFVQPDGYGGYVFGSYSPYACSGYTVPSVYCLYSGFPGYIYIDNGYVQDILPIGGSIGYPSGYQPYQSPGYQVNEYNYTVNNYYAGQPAAGTEDQQSLPAPALAQKDGAPAVAGSDQALADIQQGWLTGNFALIKKHLPATTSNVVVSIDGKASYELGSDHFSEITQDAFNKLTTYGFVLTFVQKHADGSATGYFTHTYAPLGDTSGARYTMYLTFTLTNVAGNWNITGIDSSTSQAASSQMTQVSAGR